LDENNAKAYFRLGQAFDATDNLSLAHANFYRAAQLNPNDKGIRQEIDKIKQKIEAEKALRAKDNMFVGMFSRKKE
jgi:tetratricopeptide (TPR) repeat protein